MSSGGDTEDELRLIIADSADGVDIDELEEGFLVCVEVKRGVEVQIGCYFILETNALSNDGPICFNDLSLLGHVYLYLKSPTL